MIAEVKRVVEIQNIKCNTTLQICVVQINVLPNQMHLTVKIIIVIWLFNSSGKNRLISDWLDPIFSGYFLVDPKLKTPEPNSYIFVQGSGDRSCRIWPPLGKSNRMRKLEMYRPCWYTLDDLTCWKGHTFFVLKSRSN